MLQAFLLYYYVKLLNYYNNRFDFALLCLVNLITNTLIEICICIDMYRM